MILRSLRSTALVILLAVPPILFAEITSAEEERMEALARDAMENMVPKNSVKVGFRMVNSGANVRFGNLGTVASSSEVAPASAGLVRRAYDNGLVDVDGLAPTENDGFGNQTSTPGGRYTVTGTTTTNVTDSAGNVIGTVTNTIVVGDYLSYTPGLTRNWNYTTAEQAATPGYISFSSYSATSDGASREKRQGPTGGLEVDFAHAMGKLSKRVEWSLVAGLALNGINNKSAGDVQSTLRAVTDFYSLNGQPAPEMASPQPPLPYTAPSFRDLLDSSGNTVTVNGYETTTPLSAVPDGSLTGPPTTTPGAATVHGVWQVRGAYFVARLGPAVRAQLTERLGISAGLGVAGAYAGTRYTVVESMEVPIVGTSIEASGFSDASKFLAGYYADLNLDWTANERTGLFGGVSAQKFGDYGQSVGGRTANIDLGNSVGIRGGISIRF